MARVLRRALGGLLVAALLLTALAFYTYSPYLSLAAAPDGSATSITPPSSAPLGSSSSSPAPSSTPSPSPPAGYPDRNLPSPRGQQPGIRLVATVLPGGVFEVTETVRLATPVSHLTLTPPDLRAAGRVLRSTRPYATDVVVRAGEQRAEPPRGTVRRATTVALGRPTDRFQVHYRLHDSVRHNQPSSAGRALGAVAPLISRLPGDLPVAVAVRGEAVRNLGCVGLPADQWACFAGERPNVRVNRSLPLRAALVQVQLDLKAVRQGRR
jgi:hypothetical protein